MKKSLLVFLILSIAFVSNAQPWLDSINKPYPDFKKAQKFFNDSWKGKEQEKGKGYKPFKRWEWFWEQRLQEDGTIPDRSIAWKEWEKYQSNPTSAAVRTMSAADWTFSGPSTTNSGYYGIGRLNCIAFHPTDPNTFYVGAPGGGLWKTTTGGNSWTPLTDHLPVVGVTDIAIDPVNPNTIYIVTGDGDGADTYSIGVLKSTDGGLSWNTTGLSWNVTSYKLLRRIQINPSDPQMLWVAASDGIWRTTNGGTTWSLIQSGYFIDLELKPGDPNTIHAATYNSSSSIYRSTNAGASFSFVTTISGGRRLNLAVTAHNPSIVQVLACNSTGGLLSLWKSSNSGSSYTEYFTATTTNNMLHSSLTGNGSGGQGTYDLAFTISPLDSNNIWLGGVNTWNSMDGGASWNIKTMWSGSTGGVQGVHADKHMQVFHPLNPSVLYECNDGGLYKTANNGTTWFDLSAGLGISQMYRIGASPNNPNHVLAGLQDNSTKEFKNGVWNERKSTGDGFESIVDPINSSTIYVSSYYGSISRSTTSGSSWTSIVQSSGVGVHSQGPWLTCYVINPLKNTTLLVGKKEVYKSNNSGSTWTPISAIGTLANITALAYAPSDTNTIYAAYGSSLRKTDNGGETWTVVYSGTSTISYIAVHPTNPLKLWLTFSGYSSSNKVRVSSDGGSTFTAINGSLPNLPVNCIIYQVGTNDGLYIGTDVGVYYRDNTMGDWVPYKTGLPNVVVNELEITYNNNKLWAATYGRGLWSSPLYSGCTSPEPPVVSGVIACENEIPVSLSATTASGNVIDWYTAPSGGTAILSSSNVYTATTAGIFYAETRNATTGCKSSSRTAVTVTIKSVPATPSVTNSGSNSFCSNSSRTLTSSFASGNQWYRDTTMIAGATAQDYTVTEAGNYSVRVTENGCRSNAATAVSLNVIPVPATPVISISGSNFTSSSATGNQWYLNGTLIAGATAATYAPTVYGLYTVVTTIDGCSSAASAPLSYVPTPVTTTVLDRELKIAPNPVRNQLVVAYAGRPGSFSIEIFDASGKTLLHKGRFDNRYTMNMQSFAAGIYVVRVTNTRTFETVNRMIVKQ